MAGKRPMEVTRLYDGRRDRFPMANPYPGAQGQSPLSRRDVTDLMSLRVPILET